MRKRFYSDCQALADAAADADGDTIVAPPDTMGDIYYDCLCRHIARYGGLRWNPMAGRWQATELIFAMSETRFFISQYHNKLIKRIGAIIASTILIVAALATIFGYLAEYLPSK